MAIAPGPTEIAVIRYTVKAVDVAEQLAMLGDVYAELEELIPAHFSWATYRIDGTREFVEVATGRPLPGPLPGLASFRRFRAGLDDRCEVRQFDMAHLVGAFIEDSRE